MLSASKIYCEPMRIHNSLSCLSEFGTVSQGGAREESMLEKGVMLYIERVSFHQAGVRRGLHAHYICHLRQMSD